MTGSFDTPQESTASGGTSPQPGPLGVITVTFSPGEHLPRLLDSLPPDAQVVLADNGSTDGVPQAEAAARPGVMFLDTGANLGYGAAINVAFQHLSSLMRSGKIRDDLLLITNPDVVYTSGAIDAMIECMRRHPDAGVVGPLIREPDGEIYPSARALPTLRTGIGHALLSAVWKNNPFTRAYHRPADMTQEHVCGWLSGSCLLVRTEAFAAVGGFDERYFMYMEDVDLGDRLARAGYTSVFCPSAEIRHDKGHSAAKHPRIVLPAHHASAYRYQADRLSAWYLAPVRWALWCGLKARGAVAVGLRLARKPETGAGEQPVGGTGAAT